MDLTWSLPTFGLSWLVQPPGSLTRHTGHLQACSFGFSTSLHILFKQLLNCRLGCLFCVQQTSNEVGPLQLTCCLLLGGLSPEQRVTLEMQRKRPEKFLALPWLWTTVLYWSFQALNHRALIIPNCRTLYQGWTSTRFTLNSEVLVMTGTWISARVINF